MVRSGFKVEGAAWVINHKHQLHTYKTATESHCGQVSTRWVTRTVWLQLGQRWISHPKWLTTADATAHVWLKSGNDYTVNGNAQLLFKTRRNPIWLPEWMWMCLLLMTQPSLPFDHVTCDMEQSVCIFVEVWTEAFPSHSVTGLFRLTCRHEGAWLFHPEPCDITVSCFSQRSPC